MTTKKWIKCPYCGVINIRPENFITHLIAWEKSKTHPKSVYDMLREMVEKNQIKIEVKS